MMQFPK